MDASSKQTIFISHSSVNQAVTEELYHELTGRYQLTCWMDAFDVHTDQGPFSEQIVDGLRASKLMVLVDSPAARASDYVKREILLGRDLQLPLYRCSINENQPALIRKIKIQGLALSIQLRMARAFLAAAFVLVVILAILLAGIFLLGTRVVPRLAQGNLRDLPAAFRPTSTLTDAGVILPSDPKLAAPFHFKPDSILMQDDFEDPAYENNFSPQRMAYNIAARDPQVKVGQQNGSLAIDFPVECLSQEKTWDCELELDSNILDAGAIEYFGFRARTVERTSRRGISVSISNNGGTRSRAGFGWDFTEHAMAYFRSIPALPEKDFYAYVNIDPGWHAYEVVRDTQKPAFYYYVDGQLVDTYTPAHVAEWDQAPLRLIIYSLSAINKFGGEQKGTRFEMDEFIIGGFTSR